MTETIGQMIFRLRKSLDFTQGQLAANARVTRSWLAKVEADERQRPDPDRLKRLATHLQIPANTLLAAAGYNVGPELPHTAPMPGLTGVVLVPIVSEVSAGGGFTAPDGYVAMTPPKGASSSLVSFTVRGYCMAPQIEPGDTVVVDLDREWRGGSIVLARRDGDIHVKRLLVDEHGTRLHADADGYADITDGFAVLGVVIQVMKVPR